jgi:hypothetical protein
LPRHPRGLFQDGVVRAREKKSKKEKSRGDWDCIEYAARACGSEGPKEGGWMP